MIDDPPTDNMDEPSEILGWTFNNEIILDLKELRLLHNTFNILSERMQATLGRKDGLDEIQKYINSIK